MPAFDSEFGCAEGTRCIHASGVRPSTNVQRVVPQIAALQTELGAIDVQRKAFFGGSQNFGPYDSTCAEVGRTTHRFSSPPRLDADQRKYAKCYPGSQTQTHRASAGRAQHSTQMPSSAAKNSSFRARSNHAVGAALAVMSQQDSSLGVDRMQPAPVLARGKHAVVYRPATTMVAGRDHLLVVPDVSTATGPLACDTWDARKDKATGKPKPSKPIRPQTVHVHETINNDGREARHDAVVSLFTTERRRALRNCSWLTKAQEVPAFASEWSALAAGWDLSGLGLQDKDAPMVYSLATSMANLSNLDLSDNEFSDAVAEDFADIIEQCLGLTSFSVANNRFTVRHAALFADCVGRHPRLATFNTIPCHKLEHNSKDVIMFSMSGCASDVETTVLSRFACHSPVLRVISLPDGRITDAGIAALVALITSSKVLEQVDLENNKIRTHGARLICDAINDPSVCPTLTMVTLAANTAVCQASNRELREAADKRSKMKGKGQFFEFCCPLDIRKADQFIPENAQMDADLRAAGLSDDMRKILQGTPSVPNSPRSSMVSPTTLSPLRF